MTAREKTQMVSRARSPDQLMTREQALEAYTLGSARLSFDNGERAHLREGALADFAVLDADYFEIAVEEIPTITSDLTVAGGRHVFSIGAITDLASTSQSDQSSDIPTR